MLTGLHIKNIAVIDEVDIRLSPGFTVLTGETGAGKSIIIDSINMVLGQRTSRDLIRSGQQKAVVEAMFQVEDEGVLAQLEEMGIETEDGSLLVYRDLNTEGRTAARVNGMMATAGMLREISALLVNIHGQQDNQTLLNPASHLDYLDSYAACAPLLRQYQEVYARAVELQKRIDSLAMDEQEKARRIDLLSYQADEIKKAALMPGEEDALLERREFLAGADRIAGSLEEARSLLYTGEANARDLLAAAAGRLEAVARLDQGLSRLHESLYGLSVELDEMNYQLRDMAEGVDTDPRALEELEERLDLIHSLKRKYGKSVEDILSYYEAVTTELGEIVQSDETIRGLKEEQKKQQAVLKEFAERLSAVRRERARELEQRIAGELEDLDMTRVRFRVELTGAAPGPRGADKAEFLISTNPGEPLKPMSKIASGGEMSRIMLAIKSILADTDRVHTLIFDEIDTGVSGRAAQRIAQKIAKIAMGRQVLCITHLSQIAALAENHLLIEKEADEQSTRTRVAALSDEERAEELARIIGGAKITDTTRKSAEEMLRFAEDYRKSLL